MSSEVKPALAGGDIGDVRQPLFIGPEGPEVPVEQVVSDGEVMQAVSRGDAEFSFGDCEYVIVPHELFDTSEAGVMALGQKLRMDARAAIGGVYRMDGLDRRQQIFCCKLARTWVPCGSRVITAARHPKRRTHLAHRVILAMAVNELVAHVGSPLTTAMAFFKI